MFQTAASHTPTALPRAFALLGPTASGKTGLALALAQRLPVEIISLDSALVYRGMDIGTAKPTPAEQVAAPHHLIDIISPLESYSAAQFVDDCVRLVGEIHARGRLPLIVGGTMMYYHALTQGLNDLPQADAAVRAHLAEEKAQHGLAHLYAQLKKIDPETAARLPENDSQRIERALEVWHLTGKPLSRHFAEQAAFRPPLELFSAALIPDDRARLHALIAQRFDTMMAQGLADEVRQLCERYPELHPDMPSLRCVGYRQTWDYLQGRLNANEWRERGIIATRQLAKRQLTWLRKLGADAVWQPFQPADALLQHAEHAVRQFFAV